LERGRLIAWKFIIVNPCRQLVLLHPLVSVFLIGFRDFLC